MCVSCCSFRKLFDTLTHWYTHIHSVRWTFTIDPLFPQGDASFYRDDWWSGVRPSCGRSLGIVGKLRCWAFFCTSWLLWQRHVFITVDHVKWIKCIRNQRPGDTDLHDWSIWTMRRLNGFIMAPFLIWNKIKDASLKCHVSALIWGAFMWVDKEMCGSFNPVTVKQFQFILSGSVSTICC